MAFASSKIKYDTLYNTISFAFIGVIGLLINFFIAYFYSSTILGIFNLYYALFIFLSQLAGAGIHFSVLKNVSQYEGNKDKENSILLNGIISTAINALLWLLIIYGTQNLFLFFFTKEEYTTHLIYLMPAILFFVLNKVFLSYRNAKKQMKYYAIINGLRPILMLIFILLIKVMAIDAIYCVLTFLFSEFIIFLVLSIGSIHLLLKARISYNWINSHFIHGYKSAIGSVMIDVNTRVDVLMLGYFTNEIMVGIYSMASMIVDGFTQLPIVFRTIINPYITNYYYLNKTNELRLKMIYGRNLSYKFLTPLGLLIIGGYPLALYLFGFYNNYSTSILPLTILMAGAIISIGYAPFLMIFNQTGHPGKQSLVYFLIFSVNLVLNFILIPIMGINGAAIATGISYISLLIFIKILAQKTLSISF